MPVSNDDDPYPLPPPNLIELQSIELLLPEGGRVSSQVIDPSGTSSSAVLSLITSKSESASASMSRSSQ